MLLHSCNLCTICAKQAIEFDWLSYGQLPHSTVFTLYAIKVGKRETWEASWDTCRSL